MQTFFLWQSPGAMRIDVEKLQASGLIQCRPEQDRTLFPWNGNYWGISGEVQSYGFIGDHLAASLTKTFRTATERNFRMIFHISGPTVKPQIRTIPA